MSASFPEDRRPSHRKKMNDASSVSIRNQILAWTRLRFNQYDAQCLVGLVQWECGSRKALRTSRIKNAGDKYRTFRITSRVFAETHTKSNYCRKHLGIRRIPSAKYWPRELDLVIGIFDPADAVRSWFQAFLETSLIRRRPINRRYRHVEQTQVHAELSAMMNRMTHYEAAHHRRTR